MIVILILGNLLYLNYKYCNNNNYNRFQISIFSYTLEMIQFFVCLFYLSENNKYYDLIFYYIMIEGILITFNFIYHYFSYLPVIGQNQNTVSIYQENRIPIENISNRDNLLIQESEEFECNICFEENKLYYNIPCIMSDHIICENCAKNILFNIKKCPWCNIETPIINQV